MKYANSYSGTTTIKPDMVFINCLLPLFFETALDVKGEIHYGITFNNSIRPIVREAIEVILHDDAEIWKELAMR